ncbi:MAG: oligosaccharide flippase family protein [Candidatus Caccovivens sp.]
MKSIFKNVLLITFFSVLTRLFGFLFRIFLSRTIGAEALGMYQVVLSVFMVLLTIVSSGFTLIISRMTASYRVGADKKAIGSLVTTSLFIGLAVSIFLCLIILIFRNLFQNLFTDQNCMHILIILLPSLVFSAIYSVFRGAMWGNDNYFGLCVSELLEQIVKIVICVLILASGMTALQNALAVAWSFTLSCFVSAFFVMLLYFFYGGKLNKPTKIYKKLIRQSAPITGVRVAGSFAQPLVALILPARLITSGYTSSQAMQLYGVAIGMTFPLLFLPSTLIGSLSTALVPDISMALVQNDNKHIEKRVQSSVLFALFVCFLIVPLFMAVGDKIGVFLYNDALSGKLLQYSAWIMVPMGVTNITSAILNSVGLEVKSFVNYCVGGALMFLAIFILPKYIGINALIVGMGLSSITSSILNIFMIRKRLKIEVKIMKNLLLLALFSLPTIALTSFVSSLLSYVLPLFFDIAISCVLGMVVYILLCMVFNVINFSVYLVQFKEKIAKKSKNVVNLSKKIQKKIKKAKKM